MKFIKITFIPQLITIIISFQFINIFSTNNKVEIRQCCRRKSCKEEDISDKIITNKEVKKVAVIGATKVTYQNGKGEQLEFIAENNKEKEDFIKELESNGITNNNIIEEHIYIPKEEYFNNEKSIASTSKAQITANIGTCSTEDGKKEIEFKVLTNMCTETINKLEEIHKSTHSKKIFLSVDDNGKDLNYHYIRYIIRGNAVKNIKNILFDLEKKENCWQIKQITKNNTNNDGDKIENINVDIDSYTITFDRITNDMLTCVHNVTNKYNFTDNNIDDFTCRVESIAEYSSEKSKKIKKPEETSNSSLVSKGFNFFTRFVAENCNCIPNVYTDIIYKCKYDKSTNSTFFITIGTFHYPEVRDPLKKVINSIKKQAHDMFTLLLGENFSNELRTQLKLKTKPKTIILSSNPIK